MSSSTTTTPKHKCRIAEIVQYDCDAREDPSGKSRVHCWPLPRIFRICPGRSAVEITRYVDIDPDTGGVMVSSGADQFVPQGKSWDDVHSDSRPIDDIHLWSSQSGLRVPAFLAPKTYPTSDVLSPVTEVHNKYDYLSNIGLLLAERACLSLRTRRSPARKQPIGSLLS